MAKRTSDKLKITAYSKNTFSNGDKVGEFTVRYNPKEINHTYNISYDEDQAVGSSGTENKYQNSKPEEISFDLIFDQTVVPDGSKKKYKVSEDIKKFKELVVNFNGKIHRPNYVRLSWGDITFNGQIKSASFTYTQFDSTGKALKATAKVSFIEVIDVKSRLASENKSSPDLTHIITIKEGDSLPLICNKIYNNPLYYLEVAKINKLDNFRNLKAGDRIILPPLQK